MLRRGVIIPNWVPAGTSAGGDQAMRMFETVASTLLVIAAQALVVGVVVTTL